ncbi:MULTISPECIES: hypothetical protein [unclassified Leptolyngbya]|uniref:hypothetical protein n=1 Tax=unclassified Leptolyngbya TaxID=2650499 RepID=UPI001689F903|nr:MULTISPECIES: hypothetical protein [unclassified Leptolyngbya]MBD1912394.1 hypothetical protein [Leptolyngbya sp. FACHB-8]MBD2157971.1 hypothetical protein [Leptolyngbya sp. FACHB-16]
MQLTRIVKNRACFALSIGLWICSFFYGSQLINATHLWVGLLLYSTTLGSSALWLYLVRSHQIYVSRLSHRLQRAGISAHKGELLKLPVLEPYKVDRVFSLIQEGDDFEVIQSLFAIETKA